jgi:predicted DsbA family dithiol-disulfide isomerase
MLNQYPEVLTQGLAYIRFYDMPLEFHLEAENYAKAVRCANEQGVAEKFVSIIHRDETMQTPVSTIVSVMGFDETAFDKCFTSEAVSEAVKSNTSELYLMGIKGTPTFLVNGKQISNYADSDVLLSVIQEASESPTRE